MCANSSHWTDKCGIAASFSRLAVETRAAKYNCCAGRRGNGCEYHILLIYLHTYIHTYIHVIRYKSIYVHTLALYKEIITNTFTCIKTI